MTGNNRFTLTMICFGLVIAASVLIKQSASSEQNEPKPELTVHDYAQMNVAVEDVLKEMPEITEELERIHLGHIEDGMEELLSVKKAEFRIRVENNLTKQEHSTEFMRAMAEKETGRYVDALRVAKEEYGIRVAEEEVTEFIKKNVANVRSKEKKNYAEALGLTLYQLDYQFDRDFYVMDVLWEKLTPLVMEKIPKQDGESEKAYGERLKVEFLDQEE
ncbi:MULTISPECIES: hypothetical protein [Sporosarcina]|uniref:Uncharacterized protein n=1 Tax=Sporosarcina newyorkensis TaxID=759851 RepID=A0A1T4YBP0_9BACL|nr:MULTISPECIES: hypothetical protein [Sporosarcina]MBY0223598.1 hypothetical protein [Sporosarcina aquimarina]SKA99103.1 hypothetical protein SAMN04244570_2266 [Sporosarcina newyorkensis]